MLLCSHRSIFLFRHDNLSGPGQGLGSPVDGIICVKGKVSGAVGLDEIVEIRGTIVLNGHGRKGGAHIGIGGFCRVKPGKRSCSTNYN